MSGSLVLQIAIGIVVGVALSQIWPEAAKGSMLLGNLILVWSNHLIKNHTSQPATTKQPAKHKVVSCLLLFMVTVAALVVK